MSLVSKLKAQMSLPVIGAPMFIVGVPALVIEQCINGVIGSFPALNARPAEMLDTWLARIESALDAHRRAHPGARVAPYAVNQIIHQSNDRLDHDLDACVRHRVPMIITSLRAPDDVVKKVHEYGGVVFHDVISIRHAQKALEAGVDGLILVCAGAGGHAGMVSPFALVREVRKFFSGPIALSGSITDGAGILAAEAMGADFAYIGTRFIATREANAVADYKQAIVDAADTGTVMLNRKSTPCVRALRTERAKAIDREGSFDRAIFKDVRDVYFGGDMEASLALAGQTVGLIHEVLPVADIIGRTVEGFHAIRRQQGERSLAGGF